MKVFSAIAECAFPPRTTKKKAWGLITDAFTAVRGAHCFMTTDQMIRISDDKKPKDPVEIDDLYNVGGNGAHIRVTDWDPEKGKFAFNKITILPPDTKFTRLPDARMEFNLATRNKKPVLTIVRHEKLEPVMAEELTNVMAHIVMKNLARAIDHTASIGTLWRSDSVIEMDNPSIFASAKIETHEATDVPRF